MAKRERLNVKVDADLVRKAKVVVAARHLTLADYVSALLRPQVEADLAEVVARLSADTTPPNEAPGPG